MHVNTSRNPVKSHLFYRLFTFNVLLVITLSLKGASQMGERGFRGAWRGAVGWNREGVHGTSGWRLQTPRETLPQTVNETRNRVREPGRASQKGGI